MSLDNQAGKNSEMSHGKLMKELKPPTRHYIGPYLQVPCHCHPKTMCWDKVRT